MIAFICSRLAAIDGDDGYTGVKPQHRYVTCLPWHRLSPSFRFFLSSLAYRGTVSHRRLDFFYSNTNNLVQLEDTTIKTERVCSMQCTE